jgi:tRNA threonylcarbamoyladenosine biosynthesis protein TsaB
MNDYTQKNILAIDSSSNRLILGMMYEGDKLVKSDELVEKSHGQMIVKKINDLLRSANKEIKSIEGIIVQIGPGSFTGLRIGIAAAKGIAVALDIPIVAINLFEIAAYKLRTIDDSIRVIVPLKKDQYFIATVQNQKFDSDDIQTIDNKQLYEIIKKEPFAISGINLENDILEEPIIDYSDNIKYDASDLINLGMIKLNAGNTEDIVNLEPLYLQKSQAEINFELRKNK